MGDWSGEVHGVLKKNGVTVAAYVPEGGIKKLIALCGDDPEIKTVPLANESEGPCVLAGSWLGGERGILMMQGSGVGNCINNFGLQVACNFPLLTLVPLRGSWGEGNSWMTYQGRTVEHFFELAGFSTHFIEHPEQVAPTVDAGLRMAYQANARVAVIVSQRVTGTKEFTR